MEPHLSHPFGGHERSALDLGQQFQGAKAAQPVRDRQQEPAQPWGSKMVCEAKHLSAPSLEDHFAARLGRRFYTWLARPRARAVARVVS